MHLKLTLALLFALTVPLMSCSKGGDGGGSSEGPMAPTPPNPGTNTSQNGCSVTYACPNVDINGGANPATPTLATLTLTNGTSASCRASGHRNTPDPGIPIEFTIRNPAAGFSWRNKGLVDQTLLHTDPPNPNSGAATSAGPVQTVVFFAYGAIPGIKTGLNFTQNLVMEILDARSGSPTSGLAVASCGVTVFGTFPSGL